MSLPSEPELTEGIVLVSLVSALWLVVVVGTEETYEFPRLLQHVPSASMSSRDHFDLLHPGNLGGLS